MGANGLDTTVRDFAIDLARRAGDILIDIRERGLRQDTIHPKLGHFDIVTEADLASEQFILSELAAAFPNYGVMSEETNQRLSDKEWVWIVIRWTEPPTCARPPDLRVNIGLAHGGRPVLAVTYEPTYQQTYWAMPGEGAWLRRGNSEFPCACHRSATFNTPCWRPAFSTHAMRGATTGTPNSRTSTRSPNPSGAWARPR